MELKIHKDPHNPEAQYISFGDTRHGFGIIRDFTKQVEKPWMYVNASQTKHHKRFMEPARWKNFKHNLRYVDKSKPFLSLVEERIDTAKDERVLYICGNGYSLKKNAHLLTNVKGKILALNGAIDLVQADYFMALDWTPNLKLKENKYDAQAIISVTAHPDTIRKFPNRVFISDNRYGKIDNKIRDRRPDIYGLDVNLEVGFSALHFAWLLQYRTIVTIGFEHCYDDPKRIHATEDFADAKAVLKIDLDDGREVLSNPHLMLGAQTIKAAFYFLRKAGCRVIECSNGLIDEQCEIMSLENAIDQVESDISLGGFEKDALVL